MKSIDYEIIDYPKSRVSTEDVGRFGHNKHYMFGLLEVDVTGARHLLRNLRQQGQETSFTAWMIKTIGDCVARNRYAHAMRWKRRKLIAFNDVDIAMPVERTVDGKGVPLPLLIRRTNTKSARDIYHEIQAAQQKSISDEKDFILNRHQFSRRALQMYYSAPQFIRLFFWRRIFANPFRARLNSGTVMVTTVNAVDRTTGWILPVRNMHNIAISFGSISKKPWIVKGRVEARDILHLTVAFNHDVIDGVPAGRFVQDLVKTIEEYGRDS